MTITRRHFTTQLLAGSALLSAFPALSQPRTIRLLVGFPPGGGTDAVARLLAERLKDELGANVVVDNKPGAGGQLAAQALKAAPADGLTLFLSHDHSISILPLVTKNAGFDPAADFAPVAGFATFVNAFAVSGGTPARTFADYVKWIQEGGDKAGGNAARNRGTVGVPAPASTPEFLVKLIGEKYKLDLAAAPYRGSAPMMGDMLGNQIAAGVGRCQAARGGGAGQGAAGRAGRRAHVQRAGAGRLRGCAVLRRVRAQGRAGRFRHGVRRGDGQGAGAAGGARADAAHGAGAGVHERAGAGRAGAGLHGDVGADHPGEGVRAAVIGMDAGSGPA